MLSQQSSLRGMRTALAPHPAIACADAASEGPSKKPQPRIQAYSEPERLTPLNTRGWLALSSNCFPTTCNPTGALCGTDIGTAARTEELPVEDTESTVTR